MEKTPDQCFGFSREHGGLVFFLLIHTMGVQEHLFGSYQKYYLQKWRLFERVCLGREAKK